MKYISRLPPSLGPVTGSQVLPFYVIEMRFNALTFVTQNDINIEDASAANHQVKSVNVDAIK